MSRGIRVRAVLSPIAAAVMVAALGVPAGAQSGYAFTKMVDSAEDGFFSFGFTCSAINSRGDIAFRTSRAPDEGTQVVQGVYRANASGPERITTIAEFGGGFDFVGNIPSINDRGEVAFAVREFDFEEFVTEQRVMRGGGATLQTIADTAGDFRQLGFDPTVNNSGTVAFKAQLDSDESPFSFDPGLFSGRSQEELTTHYLATTSDFSLFGPLSRASINNRGAIAFAEQVDGTFASGVFVARGGDIATIAPATTGVSVGRPNLNDAGVVGFHRSAAGVQELVRGSSADTLEVVADNTGAFSSFGFAFGGFVPPALNNAGEVAFLANLRAGGSGIFVGDDPVADRVIGTGDTLDGAVVQSLRVCDQARSDTGEIAFQATFADPATRIAIYRATPLE